MKRYWILFILMGFNWVGNVAYAHQQESWCDRYPRACEERRNAHEKHRLEKWCKRHPRACEEYRYQPPPPVYKEPPRESRESWCKRHPHKCEERREHREHRH
ncbi:MAG: hypothetical protein RIT27_2461 [Pseudomonadota bacterium]|jgi:hypothetical protein